MSTTWDATNPDDDRFVRGVITTMPALRHRGIEVDDPGPGHAVVRLPGRVEVTQHDGYVQGGVVGTLAAADVHDDGGRTCATALATMRNVGFERSAQGDG